MRLLDVGEARRKGLDAKGGLCVLRKTIELAVTIGMRNERLYGSSKIVREFTMGMELLRRRS
jgi:hypothetical protein